MELEDLMGNNWYGSLQAKLANRYSLGESLRGIFF